jgi:hypothetical protein
MNKNKGRISKFNKETMRFTTLVAKLTTSLPTCIQPMWNYSKMLYRHTDEVNKNFTLISHFYLKLNKTDQYLYSWLVLRRYPVHNLLSLSEGVCMQILVKWALENSSPYVVPPYLSFNIPQPLQLLHNCISIFI